MKNTTCFVVLAIALSACEVSTETAVYSYNGNTVEIQLYGDTFAYGSEEQKKAQLAVAQAQAEKVCGGPAQYLSRRLEHKPQNGIVFVPAADLALFKCN